MTNRTLLTNNDVTTSDVLQPLIERAKELQNFQSRELDLVEHVRHVSILTFVLNIVLNCFLVV